MECLIFMLQADCYVLAPHAYLQTYKHTDNSCDKHWLKQKISMSL